MKKVLVPENSARRVDNIGRVTLPKGLRSRFALETDDELDLFTADIEGRKCIILALQEDKNLKVIDAINEIFSSEIELTENTIKELKSILEALSE